MSKKRGKSKSRRPKKGHGHKAWCLALQDRGAKCSCGFAERHGGRR
jgi:hypothetical protein